MIKKNSVFNETKKINETRKEYEKNRKGSDLNFQLA